MSRVTSLQCRAASPQEEAEETVVAVMPEECPYPGRHGQDGELSQAFGRGARALRDLGRALQPGPYPGDSDLQHHFQEGRAML